jgi:hypothetical protein
MMPCVDRGCAESRSSERQTVQIEDVMHTVAKTMVSIPPTIRENISLGLLSMMSIVPSPPVFQQVDHPQHDRHTPASQATSRVAFPSSAEATTEERF